MTAGRPRLTALVTDGGISRYHVWVLVDGTKRWGRFCRDRAEAERFMDVAGVPRRKREWKA